MSEEMHPEAMTAYVTAAAALLDLPIAAEHRASVELHFARLASMAAFVQAHALPMHTDPAPLFHPGAHRK